MTTPVFLQDIRKEKSRIKSRFKEMEETTKALENERQALTEREDLLDNIEELYNLSQKTIEQAQEIQSRLAPIVLADTGAGYEESNGLILELKSTDLVDQ